MYEIASGTAVVVLSMLSQPALAQVEPAPRPGGVAKVIRRENLDPPPRRPSANALPTSCTHRPPYRLIATLGVSLAIVLCSVAILTKQRLFWFGGMAGCLVGLVVVGMGFLHRGEGEGGKHQRL
jgi:hypothetical protein